MDDLVKTSLIHRDTDTIMMMTTTMNLVLIAFGKVDGERLEKLVEVGRKVGTKRDHVGYLVDYIADDPHERNWDDHLKRISIR